MKGQEFEVRLLIKQNSEMYSKLLSYRRENNELREKNSDLNIWVQNLSEVFASIAAAWKTMTDNEEALYTLMRRKQDPVAKQVIGKYISHFRTFEQIINNLGDKITNEGHSDSAALDAKTRISSFVNNYQLFFLELVESFFEHNDERLSWAEEMSHEGSLHPQFRQLAIQSVEQRSRITEFKEFMQKLGDNLKNYENYNKHQLLDGIISAKEREIEDLKDRNMKQARRIAYMTDYNAQNVEAILEHEQDHPCSCGAAPLEYYRRVWEEALRGGFLQKKQSSGLAEGEETLLKQKERELAECQKEKELLIQRNAHILAKSERSKGQARITDDMILQSPLYLHLRTQFKDLLEHANQLSIKLQKNYEYLNSLQKARLEEIDQIKRKQQKPVITQGKLEGQVLNVDHSFVQSFRVSIEKHFQAMQQNYHVLRSSLGEKETFLQQAKEQIRQIKRENDDLNRRLSELQERQMNAVPHIEFRHQKFNEIDRQVGDLIRAKGPGEDSDRLKKGWQELMEYTKTRDKKIRAMEQVIKKKERQLLQKQKVEEVLQKSMAETEAIYEKYKEQLDANQSFVQNIQKETHALAEENYRLKIEAEQQKNLLSIRLKNELEVKARLQERARFTDKIEEDSRNAQELASQLEKRFLEYQGTEKERQQAFKIELREKERVIGELRLQLQQRERAGLKLVEDKEKKNLLVDKLRSQLQVKTDFDVLRMQLEDYKSKIICRCGGDREREIVLKTCPHIFCRKCIEDTTANRNRKCPICGIRFTKTDIHEINWT